MPKLVQVETSKENPEPNTGVAITAGNTLNAIFTGGGVDHSLWNDGLDGWGHVGRISLARRTWDW